MFWIRFLVSFVLVNKVFEMKGQWDVIVIGAGHAGVEAALACSRMGLKVLIATTRLSRIAFMSCNPSVGGLAKGNLVKEIDVLGGVMGMAGDFACLQYKHLNSKKGPAVRGSRVQCDKTVYQKYVQDHLQNQNNITLIEKEIVKLWVQNGKCNGVICKDESRIVSQTVILTTGTFMGAVMHVGKERQSGGRIGDQATYGLSQQMGEMGFKVTRLKTGTPPRLHKNSVNWKQLTPQAGDRVYRPLSFFSPKKPLLKQIFCYLTHTNQETHEVIKKNLHLSPLFSGIIQGAGPRYCPSIEDKVIRFSDKNSHQVFLEPEEFGGDSIYVQGLSTSLPKSVQEKFIRTIKGLKKAKFLQWGYAVEYDFINPIQVWPTLETKILPNLFLAGQVNGSSGYEEAAVQGLMAGVNASAKILDFSECVLPRHEAYTGVLIDDLVTKGTKEPYRMLTSRAEHRLVLREDNALERLFPVARKYGLLPEKKVRLFEKILSQRKEYTKVLSQTKWSSVELNNKGILLSQKKSFLKKNFQTERMWTAQYLLKRPEFSYRILEKLGLPKVSKEVAEPVEIEIKYEGYIQIQNQMIKKNLKMGQLSLKNINYQKVHGLSLEAKEKLREVQPLNLEQTQRISGVTPASLQALIVHIHKRVSACR